MPGSRAMSSGNRSRRVFQIDPERRICRRIGACAALVSVTAIAQDLTLRMLPLDVPPVQIDTMWHRRQITHVSRTQIPNQSRQ